MCTKARNYAEAAKALEAQLDDGFLDRSEVPLRLKAAAQMNYVLRNYDKTIDCGNRAIAEGSVDDDTVMLVGQAYYLEGRYAAARDFFAKRIEQLEMQHEQVPQSYLQIVLTACARLQDSACVRSYSKRLYGPRAPMWIDPILNRDAPPYVDAGSR